MIWMPEANETLFEVDAKSRPPGIDLSSHNAEIQDGNAPISSTARRVVSHVRRVARPERAGATASPAAPWAMRT
jgi:hypothetical protein